MIPDQFLLQLTFQQSRDCTVQLVAGSFITCWSVFKRLPFLRNFWGEQEQNQVPHIDHKTLLQTAASNSITA
jgi:antitoxin component of MazEF toxin-antitoxin module